MVKKEKNKPTTFSWSTKKKKNFSWKNLHSSLVLLLKTVCVTNTPNCPLFLPRYSSTHTWQWLHLSEWIAVKYDCQFCHILSETPVQLKTDNYCAAIILCAIWILFPGEDIFIIRIWFWCHTARNKTWRKHTVLCLYHQLMKWRGNQAKSESESEIDRQRAMGEKGITKIKRPR